ncbi:MAG: Coenzyme F420 hydrogenase/dehydrogenase, beta subunit C-terminal domain [Planctomycetes bacterium]|jgi:ferredoxin|nr:Coenzyme F420 hydrogenase/dehydrogenase, beta subunit C-terminal domain [Planctomycetota bacterium]
MQTIQAQIRKTAADLLDGKKADVVIAYENGTLPMRTRPSFVRSSADAGRLVWTPFCSNNLAAYLPRYFPKAAPPKKDAPPPPRVAVLAKACDLRSLAGLLREHQAPRDRLVTVGVPCMGMADPDRVEKAAGGAVLECAEAEGGDLRVLTRKGDTVVVGRESVLAQVCLECRAPAPEGADVTLSGPSRKPAGRDFADVRAFEGKSAAARWAALAGELSRCIRCNACRQACPNCYCRECFADQTSPRWVGAADDVSEKVLYHLGRMLHMAGRCVNCDACVRACPMGIDLRTLTRKITADVEELFGSVPGCSPSEVPAMCAFHMDDKQEFITEP